jgi:hypothetical protein
VRGWRSGNTERIVVKWEMKSGRKMRMIGHSRTKKNGTKVKATKFRQMEYTQSWNDVE